MGKDVFRLINDPVNVSDSEQMAHPFFRKQVVIYKEDSLALFLNQGSSWECAYEMWLFLLKKEEEEEENWRWVKTVIIIGPFVHRELLRFAVVGSWGKQQLILLLDHETLERRHCSMVLFDLATGAT
ncbi:hypothetical protein LINGRAHAP2_LOCUS31112 [Linum grandiflorum]